MREQPTWRIPAGILGLLATLTLYGVAVASYAPGVIGEWPTLAQTLVYIVLGLIWLLPLKRFLSWMETGNWNPPQ